MKRLLLTFGLAFGLAALTGHFGTGARAEDKKDEKATEAKLEKRTPATSIDFAAATGISSDILGNLGNRIESARTAGNPIALTSLAAELSAAEKAGGKKAELTGEALQKEAIELAKLRNKSGELKLLAAMLSDKGAADELTTQAKAAAKVEENEAKQIKLGTAKRGIQGSVTVQNGTPHRLLFYVNGVQTFYVNPYKDFTWYIGAAPNTNTTIYCVSANGQYRWKTETIFRNINHYTYYCTGGGD